MKDEKFKELLHLYVMNELGDEEKEIVENHLMESDDYRKEYEELKKFYSSISDNKPKELSDEKLNNFRNELIENIKSESVQESVWNKTFDSIKNIFFGNYSPIYAMAITLFAGFLLGYVVFSSTTPQNLPALNPNEIDLDAVERNEMNISNIRFQNPFGGEGDIEINFDAVTPISYKGKIDDPRIQRLLAAALTKSDNPGVRIRTVNTISSQTSEVMLRDPKIKISLINALKTDENDGVRREALNALMKFPYAEDIRDAFLFVLSNDQNPGLKIGAINALAQMKLQGRSIDNELRNVIENELVGGEEEFIKLKAASLIREVK